MPSLNLDQFFFLETGEQPADGFERESEVIAQVLARHAELEQRAALAQAFVPARETEQAGSQPLLGAHAPEHHQQTLVLDDLAAHDAEQLVLETRHFLRQILKGAIRYLAHLGRLQRLGAARVPIGVDGIHTKQLARQMESRDLHAAVFHPARGLERANTHGIKRFERIAEAVQLLALAQRAAAADDVVEGLEIGVAPPQRQAQLTQATIFAGYLDTGDTNDLGIFIFLHAAFSLSPENLGPPRHFNRNRKAASMNSAQTVRS